MKRIFNIEGELVKFDTDTAEKIYSYGINDEGHPYAALYRKDCGEYFKVQYIGDGKYRFKPLPFNSKTGEDVRDFLVDNVETVENDTEAVEAYEMMFGEICE